MTHLSKRNKIGAQANPTAVPPVGFHPLSLYILVKIAVPEVCPLAHIYPRKERLTCPTNIDSSTHPFNLALALASNPATL